VRITPDTNLLIRAVVADDRKQAKLAQDALANAETIAVTVSALCELVWVLRRGYSLPAIEIANAIRRLVDSTNVETNRPAVSAGLALLEDGGDFADGAIAFEGASLGAETFLSFDRDAVKRLNRLGQRSMLLA
jgi:predicted nucleic-acid-binding protein